MVSDAAAAKPRNTAESFFAGLADAGWGCERSATADVSSPSPAALATNVSSDATSPEGEQNSRGWRVAWGDDFRMSPPSRAISVTTHADPASPGASAKKVTTTGGYNYGSWSPSHAQRHSMTWQSHGNPHTSGMTTGEEQVADEVCFSLVADEQRACSGFETSEGAHVGGAVGMEHVGGMGQMRGGGDEYSLLGDGESEDVFSMQVRRGGGQGEGGGKGHTINAHGDGYMLGRGRRAGRAVPIVVSDAMRTSAAVHIEGC